MTLPTIGRTVIYQHVTGHLVSYGGSTSGSQKVTPLPATVRAQRANSDGGGLELQIVERNGESAIVIATTQGDGPRQWNWPEGTQERRVWAHDQQVAASARLYDGIAERCAKAEAKVRELEELNGKLKAQVDSAYHGNGWEHAYESGEALNKALEKIAELEANNAALRDEAAFVRRENTKIGANRSREAQNADALRKELADVRQRLANAEALSRNWRGKALQASQDSATFERFARASRAMLGSFAMKPGGSIRGLISQLSDATQEHAEARDAAFALLDRIDEPFAISEEEGTAEEDTGSATLVSELATATMAARPAFVDRIAEGYRASEGKGAEEPRAAASQPEPALSY